MTKFVVTGGAGFIGSHIVEELLKYNYKVTIIDSLISGSKENIAHVLDRVDFRQEDIRDKAALKNAFKDADYVLHQAASRSVPKSFDDPESYIEHNIQGTFNVFEIAKQCNIKRVVYASSSSVYGNSKSFPQKETDHTFPISPYAITKLTTEQFGYVYSKNFGLYTVGLRYFNVFGPRQDPNAQYAAVIAAFCKRMKAGLLPMVHGTGTQSRDFTYVKDVAEANIAACFAGPAAAGMSFNVCGGSSISILDIIETINRILGKKIKPEYSTRRAGDIEMSNGSLAFVKQHLNWNPRYTFENGLKATLDFF